MLARLMRAAQAGERVAAVAPAQLVFVMPTLELCSPPVQPTVMERWQSMPQ